MGSTFARVIHNNAYPIRKLTRYKLCCNELLKEIDLKKYVMFQRS